MKKNIIIHSLLIIAIVFLAFICIKSVITPIKFEEKRQQREVAVIKNLSNIRLAEAEFKLVKGRYTADLDSLVLFLQTEPKKEVLKEGSLSDKQLENGLTEAKATKILERAILKAKVRQGLEDIDAIYAYIWDNDKEVVSNGLKGFRRDTIFKNMIETVYKGAYTSENIGQIIYIPYTNGKKFDIQVNNEYTTSQGIHVPLMEVSAHFNTYLADLDNQERVNLIDKEEKLEHFPGLKIGDITAPNNNAGNWE